LTSLIAFLSVDAPSEPVSHQEVLAASDRAAGAIGRTLAAILDRL